MVETVLDNVAVPLRDVQNAYTQVDPLDVGASYMWATLQSVQVWRNFRQASWRGHPLVSPQITLYLFQNRASKSELEELLGRNKQLEDKVQSLTKQVNAVEATAGGLSNQMKAIKQGKAK